MDWELNFNKNAEINLRMIFVWCFLDKMIALLIVVGAIKNKVNIAGLSSHSFMERVLLLHERGTFLVFDT